MKWSLFPDLKVKTDAGEIIEATCVSAPDRFGPDPLKFDFAILKLKTKPKAAPTVLTLRDPASKHSVGDAVVFSVIHCDACDGDDTKG